MQLCTSCNEFSADEYFDRYDEEIYIRCRICGKIQQKTVPETAVRAVKKEMQRRV